MRSLPNFIFLFALYFTSLFFTAHATPPALKTVLSPGAIVYRVVTGGELAYIDSYVAGSQPPHYLPIAGDFAKYGALYTFATLQEALEWGMHVSGFYYKQPSDHIKHAEYIYNFYIVEMKYDPKDLKPTTKFFAKGGQDYISFVQGNYPAGQATLQWEGEPKPAVADIIEGPMSGALGKEPPVRSLGSSPGLYNHQIAFASDKALACLTVVTKIHSDELKIKPTAPGQPPSCCNVQ
ncbi:hypothetical protein CVT24_012094 [Panaeolus cyanescens]|uniref:Uncharacterized protein n=1 Tax=Panaeolus cyanescens TaxID=181874 RepID=A0A409X2X5_9AGAR|nr:hypothetical protein CVT24_012094 [Panaeolus cyanescens]